MNDLIKEYVRANGHDLALHREYLRLEAERLREIARRRHEDLVRQLEGGWL